MLAALCGGALAAGAAYPWEARLRGDRIVLLGEVHDNAVLQRRRYEILERALLAGWRPAIAMEQFDRGQQADLDRARSVRPGDAAYLIQQASHGAGGWNWSYYRPYIALALRYHLPLLAANLSRRDAEKIVSHGYTAVFDAATIRALGLDRLTPALLAAQEREVDKGHCHLLPQRLLPGMARAQMARDALMAATLRDHAGHGVVLLAGDGHVRRDLDVPRWLGKPFLSRVWSVGFLERGVRDPPADAFDAVVIGEPARRSDPCTALRRDLRQH